MNEIIIKTRESVFTEKSQKGSLSSVSSICRRNGIKSHALKVSISCIGKDGMLEKAMDYDCYIDAKYNVFVKYTEEFYAEFSKEGLTDAVMEEIKVYARKFADDDAIPWHFYESLTEGDYKEIAERFITSYVRSKPLGTQFLDVINKQF